MHDGRPHNMSALGRHIFFVYLESYYLHWALLALGFIVIICLMGHLRKTSLKIFHQVGDICTFATVNDVSHMCLFVCMKMFPQLLLELFVKLLFALRFLLCIRIECISVALELVYGL